jgi:hypothetical protein
MSRRHDSGQNYGKKIANNYLNYASEFKLVYFEIK